jgi:serine/threonine protein kinase
MSPQVIQQSAYDGCADVWSAGITAIELCKGTPPYAARVHPFQAIMLIPKVTTVHLARDYVHPSPVPPLRAEPAPCAGGALL